MPWLRGQIVSDGHSGIDGESLLLIPRLIGSFQSLFEKRNRMLCQRVVGDRCVIELCQRFERTDEIVLERVALLCHRTAPLVLRPDDLNRSRPDARINSIPNSAVTLSEPGNASRSSVPSLLYTGAAVDAFFDL